MACKSSKELLAKLEQLEKDVAEQKESLEAVAKKNNEQDESISDNVDNTATGEDEVVDGQVWYKLENGKSLNQQQCMSI